ncbi:MAG: sensor domain-containing diguanylate cyclase [Micromonosporaceae bacterium]|nr:sensor domain-containing diguanylate cyclase [Micromonosporaceae bacterium]
MQEIYVDLRETPPPCAVSPADLAELAPVPILVCDLGKRRIRYANPACAALAGRGADELVGSPLAELLRPSASPLPTGATGTSSGLPAGEYALHRSTARPGRAGEDQPTAGPGRAPEDEPEQTSCFVEARASEVTFDGLPCAQVVLFDITERVDWEQRLVHQASHDTLTGLPNAWYADLHLHRVLDAASEEPDESTVDIEQLAVFFIDLDGFKQINDVYGHHVGDAVLRQTARRLRAATSGAELTARLHGDEFLAVCRVANAIHADYLARRIRQALARPIVVGRQTVGVTASVGIAVSTPGAADADRLLRFADHRMYTDKRRPLTSEAPAAAPRATPV